MYQSNRHIEPTRLRYTGHARKRMAQRAISREMAHLLVALGAEEEQKGAEAPEPRGCRDCTEIALEHARRACRPGAASWRDGSGRQVHLPRAVWTAARYGAAHALADEC